MMLMENFLLIKAGFRLVQMKELLVNSFWNSRCAEVERRKIMSNCLQELWREVNMEKPLFKNL